MKNNFDIKQFLIENKITRNSNTLKENEFELGPEDYELANQFNVKYLKPGDMIEPEMWEIEPNDITNTTWVVGDTIDGYVDLKSPNGYEISGWVDEINNILKPEYKILDSVDESFELGNNDLELAKGLNTRFLTQGDIIEPEMWNQESDAIRELYYIDLNKPYKITGFLGDWDEVEDMDGEAAQYVTLQNSNNKEEYEAVYWVQRALKPQFQLEAEPLDLDEEFTLGDEDFELAKQLDKKFLKSGDIITPEMWGESFDPNFQDKPLYILNIGTDEDGEFITLQQQTGYEFDFDLYEINGYLKPEYGIMTPLDESFELGDEDLKLAKQLNDEPEIQVDVHLIYNWNSDSKAFPSVPDHETTYRLHYSINELVELIDKYSPYETYTANEIPSKLKDKAFIEVLYESLLELAYEELGQLADLYGYRSSHLVEEWIQDKAYKVFNPINWSKFPQDAWNLDEMEVTADLIKPLNRVNEDFELGDEDLKLAKDFNKRELKVGDYFYDSTIPKLAGAWTKLEDTPSVIRNLVKKIIYIGPNEGQYKEPIYGDDRIIAFEFAINPENVYTLTVDSFNKDFTDVINAYIPTENLDESFELDPDDLELAKGLDEENWTGETYKEFKEWAVPILIKANFELDNIKEYMLDMYDYGDMEPYLNITNKELIGDFDAYLENNIL